MPESALTPPVWDDYFGENSAYQGGGGFHYGFDQSGAAEGTPVLAAMDGEVLSVTDTCKNRPAGQKPQGDPTAYCGGDDMKAKYPEMFGPPGGNNGNNVAVLHSDGSITLYAHLSKVQVTEGQQLAAGEQLGLSGNSGFSNGPHLHWEYWVNGPEGLGRVDPLEAIPWWNP